MDNIFNKNNYNKDFVRRNTYKDTESKVTNNDTTPVTTVTIPYVKDTSETIAQILQPYNIRVAHKPITTLRQLLTKVKDKDEPNRRQGAVYKVKCCDSQATYIGETGRNLNVRLTEHKHQLEMVISTITLLSTIYKRTTESIGTLPSALPTVQITINDSIWKAGLPT